MPPTRLERRLDAPPVRLGVLLVKLRIASRASSRRPMSRYIRDEGEVAADLIELFRRGTLEPDRHTIDLMRSRPGTRSATSRRRLAPSLPWSRGSRRSRRGRRPRSSSRLIDSDGVRGTDAMKNKRNNRRARVRGRRGAGPDLYAPGVSTLQWTIAYSISQMGARNGVAGVGQRQDVSMGDQTSDLRLQKAKRGTSHLEGSSLARSKSKALAAQEDKATARKRGQCPIRESRRDLMFKFQRSASAVWRTSMPTVGSGGHVRRPRPRQGGAVEGSR